MNSVILTLNAGSSSIKFGLYDTSPEPVEELTGHVDALGTEASLVLEPRDQPMTRHALGQTDHDRGVSAILDAIAPFRGDRRVAGVGHRVVHGGPDLSRPVRLDDAMIDILSGYTSLAPIHQPHNLAAVHAARRAFPDAVQVAAFDTAFHRGHPWVNDTFGLPRRYYARGVRRYGFHGLSYDYISGVLERDFPHFAQGKVIVAHLGNGASICAINRGRSVGSSMGFSALDGLPMGTRPGQLDPGVVLYLMDHDGMNADQIMHLLYNECGLKGLSGISHDMRTLLSSPSQEAHQAIDYYVFRLAREIGAMSAVLGGVDALIFTGGIGEHAAPIRVRALERLGFLGLEINHDANAVNATEIHSGPVPVLVIPTDEERIIARATVKELNA